MKAHLAYMCTGRENPPTKISDTCNVPQQWELSSRHLLNQLMPWNNLESWVAQPTKEYPFSNGVFMCLLCFKFKIMKYWLLFFFLTNIVELYSSGVCTSGSTTPNSSRWAISLESNYFFPCQPWCYWLLFEWLELLSLVSFKLSLFVSKMSLTAFGRSSPNNSAVTGFDRLQRCL